MKQQEIGTAIAEARKAQGLSIRELAKRCKISPTTLQAVEKGWYNGKISTYIVITTALGLEITLTE